MTMVSSASRRLSVVDETVADTPAESCSLFMQLAEPFLSFCLLDRQRNKFIALCEYRLSDKNSDEEFNELLSRDEILSKADYSKECIAIYTETSSLLPASIFNKERSENLLSLTNKIPNDSTLAADQLKLTDAVHLYALPNAVVDIIKQQFPSATIVHTGTVFIESELMRNKHNTERAVAVNVRQRSFDIVVTEGDKLLLYNSFAYQTSEDFIYYLLHVMDQLKLNPEKAQLTFTGEIEKQLSTFLISAKYIRNIKFGNRPNAFEFSYGFAQVSLHAHHILLNEFLCVS